MSAQPAVCVCVTSKCCRCSNAVHTRTTAAATKLHHFSNTPPHGAVMMRLPGCKSHHSPLHSHKPTGCRGYMGTMTAAADELTGQL